jgi:hypothetical protein
MENLEFFSPLIRRLSQTANDAAVDRITLSNKTKKMTIPNKINKTFFTFFLHISRIFLS